MTDTDNWRVQKLLDLARKYYHEVVKSDNVSDCWTIRKIGNTWGSPSLTVYAGSRHSAHVMYDNAYSRDWQQVTQTEARQLIVHRSL